MAESQFEIRESDPTVPPHKPCDIYVNGRKVGDLTPRFDSYTSEIRWMASIRPEQFWPERASFLPNAHGHAGTMEQAIRNAVDDQIKKAVIMVEASEQMERSFGIVNPGRARMSLIAGAGLGMLISARDALADLLECPDLCLDDLDTKTKEVIAKARRTYEKINALTMGSIMRQVDPDGSKTQAHDDTVETMVTVGG